MSKLGYKTKINQSVDQQKLLWKVFFYTNYLFLT